MVFSKSFENVPKLRCLGMMKLMKKLRALNTYEALQTQILYNICHQCYMYWFNKISSGITYTKIKISTIHTARIRIFLKDFFFKVVPDDGSLNRNI